MKKQIIPLAIVFVLSLFSFSCTSKASSEDIKTKLEKMYSKQLLEWELKKVSSEQVKLISPFAKKKRNSRFCYQYIITLDPLYLDDYSNFLMNSDVGVMYRYSQNEQGCSGQEYTVLSTSSYRPNNRIANIAADVIEKKWNSSPQNIVINRNISSDSCLVETGAKIQLIRIEELDNEDDIDYNSYRADVICEHENNTQNVMIFIKEFFSGEQISYEVIN